MAVCLPQPNPYVVFIRASATQWVNSYFHVSPRLELQIPQSHHCHIPAPVTTSTFLFPFVFFLFLQFPFTCPAAGPAVCEKQVPLPVMSGFRRDVLESCALVGSYWRFGKKPIPPMDCPEMSGRNHHFSLRNNPEERSSHLPWVSTLPSTKQHVCFLE